MVKKKITPKYETRTFDGVVYERQTTLPDGRTVKVKDIRYLHPQYRQIELNHYAVGDRILTKETNLKRKRTDEQNRFMHLYFTLIAVSHGHGVTTQDVKSWAVGKHLAKGITEVFGDRVRKVKGTSQLTVGEMIEFLARVECDTGLPMPDSEPFNLPLTYDEFNDLKQKEMAKYRAMKPEIEGI